MLRGPQISKTPGGELLSRPSVHKNTSYIKCFKMHRLALYLLLMQENSFWEFRKPFESFEGSGKWSRDSNAKFNTHQVPSIRPFPVPLDKGSHSPLGSLPSYKSKPVVKIQCMTALPLSAYQENSGSRVVKQRLPETAEAIALRIPEPWPRQTSGRGFHHPGLGL